VGSILTLLGHSTDSGFYRRWVGTTALKATARIPPVRPIARPGDRPRSEMQGPGRVKTRTPLRSIADLMADGDDAGTFDTAVSDWHVGDTLIADGNRHYRVTAVGIAALGAHPRGRGRSRDTDSR
jgi:hypothetical protein